MYHVPMSFANTERLYLHVLSVSTSDQVVDSQLQLVPLDVNRAIEMSLAGLHSCGNEKIGQ